MQTYTITLYCDRINCGKKTETTGGLAFAAQVPLYQPNGWLVVYDGGDGCKHFCPECAGKVKNAVKGG
jgi:hypothetical protein